MQQQPNPLDLSEGEKWLSCLRKPACSNFRVYADYIRHAVNCGYYTYSELHTTETEVLELAIVHAGTAAKDCYPHQLALKNHLLCELQKVQGAQCLPSYATLVVDNASTIEKKQRIAA